MFPHIRVPRITPQNENRSTLIVNYQKSAKNQWTGPELCFSHELMVIS